MFSETVKTLLHASHLTCYLLTLTTPSLDTVRGSRAVSPEVARVLYRPSTLLRHPTQVTREDRVEDTAEVVTIRHATSSSLLRLNTELMQR